MLHSALDAQADDGATGMGLMPADRVARAHGRRLRLPDAGPGLTVELELGPTAPGAPQPPPT